MSKTWIVTGATGGLGRAIVEAALAVGDSVVATSRRPEVLSDLASVHRAQLKVVTLDVSDSADCGRAVSLAYNTFGSMDVVVNNAGFATSAAAEDLGDADLRLHLETNFFGAVHVTKAALPVMRAQGHGLVLQMSSVAGRFGATPGLAAYYASKRALEGWTEVLAAEVKPLGIDMILVEPGAFRTNFVTTAEHIPPSPQYAATVGARQNYRRDRDGMAPGDPKRAAELLVRVSRMRELPLRLLLGSDAVDGATRAAAVSADEATAWAELSRSTDYSL